MYEKDLETRRERRKLCEQVVARSSFHPFVRKERRMDERRSMIQHPLFILAKHFQRRGASSNTKRFPRSLSLSKYLSSDFLDPKRFSLYPSSLFLLALIKILFVPFPYTKRYHSRNMLRNRGTFVTLFVSHCYNSSIITVLHFSFAGETKRFLYNLHNTIDISLKNVGRTTINKIMQWPVRGIIIIN